MFTNPLNRKYQTGGKISKQQYAKAFVSWLKTNKDEFKDKSESEIVQAISDMSKSKDGKKATASLRMEFEKNNPEYKDVLDDSKTENAPKKEDTSEEQESKFADGGKMQYFICKHSRGGNVNCGCGGNVIRGEDGLPDIDPNSREARQAKRRAKRAPDLNGVARRSTSYIETPQGKWGFEEGDVNGNTTETYFFAPNRSIPTQVDTPWVQKIYTPYGYRIVNGDQNSPEWRTIGPRVKDILQEEDGGILKGQQGLSRAAGYYQRHANEGIIRKLQNFLYARGYYDGDLNGRFDRNMYEAVRQYQRDYGLKDDGMWGEDTNEVHRVLGTGETTFNGSRSGAHPGKHTFGPNFVNQPYQRASKVSYSDINNAIARAISDPEWFMGDTEDAKNWRILFMKKNPDGSRIFDQIYDSNPEFFGQSRFNKKLPTDLAKEGYIGEINTARDEAASKYVLPALTTPIVIANPLGTAASVAGGLVGQSIGANVGSDMKRAVLDENGNLVGYQGINSAPIESHTAVEIPTVTPDQRYKGAVVGGIIGTIAGGLARGALKNIRFSFNPRYNPTGIEMKLPKPTYKEIVPKKDWWTIKPKGGGNKRPGAAQNFLGKPAEWIRRITGQPIEESEISGYFMEKCGGKIKKMPKKACGGKTKK